MGEVFAAATLGGLLGPQLLIDLGLQRGAWYGPPWRNWSP